jgi:hypothetical protein
VGNLVKSHLKIKKGWGHSSVFQHTLRPWVQSPVLEEEGGGGGGRKVKPIFLSEKSRHLC